MSRERDRKPRRPRNGGRGGTEGTLKELDRQVRQIGRSLDTAARSFQRISELLGELTPSLDGESYGEPHNGGNRAPEAKRLQPVVDLPGAAQSSTLALEQALTTRIEERAKDFLTEAVELFEDADRGIPELRDYSMRARSAYLAVWAGRGRALQAKLEPWWDELPEGVEKSFRVFFGKLTTVTKRLRCEWVDALHRAWSTDWEIYVRFYQRRLAEDLGEDASPWELSEDDDQMLARDRLEGLLQRSRPRPSDARQLILDAYDVLDVDDQTMGRVLRQYAGLLRGHEEFAPLLADAGLADPGPADPGPADTDPDDVALEEPPVDEQELETASRD